MTLAELVRRALKRKETDLKVWRPSWPRSAYLEITFDEKGIIGPTGKAVLTDEAGREKSVEMVMMLFAPVATDYEEWLQ